MHVVDQAVVSPVQVAVTTEVFVWQVKRQVRMGMARAERAGANESITG